MSGRVDDEGNDLLLNNGDRGAGAAGVVVSKKEVAVGRKVAQTKEGHLRAPTKVVVAAVA
jgi:hypothetical protein